MSDIRIRVLRVELFVPSEITGAKGAAASFAFTWAGMAQPSIDSSEQIPGGTRVVLLETDYGLLEQLGAYDAPADQP